MIRNAILAAGAASLLATLSPAMAQAPDAASSLTDKLNAYVGCINRLSERAYDSRARYFSWASKSGPTGRERIIYGTYTIYDTSDCRSKVERANALEPREEALERAASSYAQAVSALEPLLKDADDYYTAQDYKDDGMAKGRALHPRLVAAWDAFARADQDLRGAVEAINERRSAERLIDIERTEGRLARYHIEALMINAKRVLRTVDGASPNLAAMTQTLGEYESLVKAAEALSAQNPGQKIGSSFIDSAKTFLVSGKQLMRRVRDKVPYSTGDRMMINAGSSWMVEGSPGRLLRDYNTLVESYNSGPRT